MLLRRHATIADYLTTICRLFRDCPATIPDTRREPRGNLRVVLRGRAVCLGGRSGGRSAGRPRAALARRAAGSAEDLRARARTRAAVSRRRGECLYLRRNRPLNARSCFRGIPIYPRYKRAVYARFRGVFRDNAENRPGKRGHTLRGGGYSAQVGGARGAGGSQVLQAVGVSPEGAASHGWSWRHSTEPETAKSPGRLRAYRGGCLLGVFRRVNEYQERHEQNI